MADLIVTYIKGSEEDSASAVFFASNGKPSLEVSVTVDTAWQILEFLNAAQGMESTVGDRTLTLTVPTR